MLKAIDGPIPSHETSTEWEELDALLTNGWPFKLLLRRKGARLLTIQGEGPAVADVDKHIMVRPKAVVCSNWYLATLALLDILRDKGGQGNSPWQVGLLL